MTLIRCLQTIGNVSNISGVTPVVNNGDTENIKFGDNQNAFVVQKGGCEPPPPPPSDCGCGTTPLPPPKNPHQVMLF